MKLEKIKLSGFKSFVDPTSIPISGNLTAIVGPNGCGKSNIIDAVRWVMGESSAKHLRGGSMADVIFNGSASRKPVGTASVELVFDNSAGKAGGQYAQYNNISIKRQVSRDGQSIFLLNNARCRRKDITDLFLGTGLGSRSYAIIEQGTISRMVEAKPDELRVYIEEAAGVSKYKERRQETETRMLNTRENLERLNDVRDEVGKQLKHLQKQAEKAEKYAELKKQERQYKRELLAMRWDIHHAHARGLEAELQNVAQEHNRLFALLKALDAEIDNKRGEHKQRQRVLNDIQGRYYHVTSEIGRLQQAIKLNKKSHEETVREIERLQQQVRHAAGERGEDQRQLEAIRQELLDTEELLESAREEAFEVARSQQAIAERRKDWQRDWETYLSDTASHKEQVHVQRVRKDQMANHNRQLNMRLDKLNDEHGALTADSLQESLEILTEVIEELETRRSQLQWQVQDVLAHIQDIRQHLKEYQQGLHASRSELHDVKGKIASLELLQQHAMGKDNKHLNGWLEQMQLTNHRR
ncbi:MAG: chromosome segregation SMC family protein, partial [Gammaproteobacteria bacterium]